MHGLGYNPFTLLLDLNQAHDAGLRLLVLNDLALQATKSVQRRSWFLFLAYWQFSLIVLCCHCSQSSDSDKLSNTAVRVQMRLLGLGAPRSSSAGESSKCCYV
ncbi:hypothetical protein VPH35_065169 [Triticum aestivum]